ncbi:hypothetical protein [Bacillus velezensis]|uniref:hypothetical protein n=1 Tax=Bacillus velezensis TaxID=492670 RepID=UPI002DB870CB|nr:hypothetical protein [Bacillus velezensis]MEC2162888.1 hypothetical protein [Bacillus velezensis]MEC2195954.1 hypothetical protein [Bacillus velezensis]
MSDSLYLIEEATDIFEKIVALHEQALIEDLDRSLSFKVKNFLETLNSSLDYAAYDLFEIFCLEKAKLRHSNINHIKRKIYFPCYPQEKTFDKEVNKCFVGLESDHKEIFQLLKKSQPFYYGDFWLKEFKNITNESKHIKLTRNKKLKSGVINYATIPGINMSNLQFKGSEHPFSVNGVPVKDLNNNPYTSEYNGKVNAYFSFEKTRKPVLDTLQFYLKMIKGIVTQINSYCESNS